MNFLQFLDSASSTVHTGWSIADKASVAIAIASGISVVIILVQAAAMGLQTKYSNRLIEIELNRDRQANSVSSWIEVSSWHTPTLPVVIERIGNLSGYLQVRLLNQSSLPIYNVRPHHLGYWDQEKEFLFYQRDLFRKAELNVLPPGRGEILWFGIGVTENSLSLAIQDQTHENVFKLDSTHISLNEIKKLSISFRFRCSDGTQWERRIDGSLEPILNMDVW